MNDVAVAQGYQATLGDGGTYTQTIDTSKPVGGIDGDLAVSLTGAATYTIPIAVPPGTNGLQPGIALSYNSQYGDGIMGIGWSMTGISAITRTGLDWYHEGMCTAGTSGGSYRFNLDGMRLALTSSSYGADGSTYDTEAASFSIITAHGTIGSGPEYFTMITKGGMTYEFGRTSDSRVQANSGDVMVWYVNRVIDPMQNYFTYTYSEQNAERLLTGIDYTGNALVPFQPYNRVRFDYQGRSDVNECFALGTGRKLAHILVSITIESETHLANRYALNYITRDVNKTYLQEVVKYGSDGVTSLNSTVFNYGNSGYYSNPTDDAGYDHAQTVYSVDAYNATMMPADLDGDGRQELVVCPRYEDEAGEFYNTEMRTYRLTADGGGLMEQTMPTVQIPNSSALMGHTSPLSGSDPIYLPLGTELAPVDMDGDGRDDIVMAHFIPVLVPYPLPGTTWPPTHIETGIDYVRVYFSHTADASAFDVQDFTGPVGYQRENGFSVGDFDGDGRTDFIASLENNMDDFETFFTSPGLGVQNIMISTDASFIAHSRKYVGNFDGDAAQELLLVNGNQTIIEKLIPPGNGMGYHFERIYGPAGYPTSDHEIFQGDFNGDGTTDLLSRYGESGDWTVNYLTSAGFVGVSISLGDVDLVNNSDTRLDRLIIADYNGDGASDIAHMWEANSSVTNFQIFYSRGMHVAPHQGFFSTPWQDCGLHTMPAINIDMNGDGRSEILNGVPNSGGCYPLEIYWIKRGRHDRMLTNVSNGMGLQTAFNYAFMTEEDVHAAGDDFAYPNGSRQFPLEVVRAVAHPGASSPDPVEPSAYAYGGARVNRIGRGFLGFETVVAADVITNSLSMKTFELNEDYCISAPEIEYLFRFSDMELLRTEVQNNEFVAVDVPTKRFLHKVTSSTGTDQLSGVVRQVNSWYDDYGNVTSETVQVGDVETTQTVTTYVARGPSPVLAKPELVTVTKTRGANPPATESLKKTYNPTTGLATLVEERYGTWAQVSRQVDYFLTGGVQDIRESYPVCPLQEVRHRRFRMDPYYRFDTDKTEYWNNNGSEVGMNTHIEYDERWGKPLRCTTSDGLETTNRYDAFGGLVQVHVPHIPGTARYVVEHEAHWYQSENDIFYRRVLDPGGPDETTWFDHHGRVTHTQKEGYEGMPVTTEKTYDGRSRVLSETAPHIDGEDILTTIYEYDSYDRPWKVTNELNGTVEFGYEYADGQLTTTITNAVGQARSTTTDATGRTVRSLDGGGEVTNAYDSRGNLLESKHNGVTQVTNVYNMSFRQETHDIDAGTTYYMHDPFGQLLAQWDGDMHQISCAYDNLGRIKSRTTAEGTTSYTYFNENGKLNDNPKTIVGPGGSFTYEYNDPYNRLSKEIKVIAGEVFMTRYGYDDYDHVTTVTYPSGVTINNTYDVDGTLTAVQRSGMYLFKGLTKGGMGRYNSYVLPDGNTMEIERHFGMPVRYHAGVTQDLNLEYESGTGNLLSRWDKVVDRKEIFTYDALDRLTSSTVISLTDAGVPLTGISNATFSYDGSIGGTKGNLKTKTDIGLFGYSAHAVVGANGMNFPNPPTDPPNDISHETQDVVYNSFNKVSTITEPVGLSTYQLTYAYGPDQQRITSTLSKDGTEVDWKVYLGAYERHQASGGISEQIHYISGGDGLCAIIVVSNGSERVYTVYKDQLGSLVTLTQQDGTVAAYQSFDAWGRVRDPYWGSGTPVQPSWLYRGYTGHEHVAPFSLINMNGRMYDPINARMLSPDNFVADATNSQSYNRYSYVNNNPMCYTDPSGQLLWWIPIIVGATAGGYVGGLQHDGWTHLNPWDWTWDAGMKTAVGRGAILGAGVGGLYTGVASAWPFGNIKGIATSKAGSILSVTNRAWDIVSNSVSQGAINVLSAAAQNRSEDDILAAGAVGLLSGALGGAWGAQAAAEASTGNQHGINAMTAAVFGGINRRTSMINGFLDRYVYSVRNGNKEGAFFNGLYGATESLSFAAVADQDFINEGFGLSNLEHAAAVGRYSSMALTQIGSSTPGLGTFVGGIYSTIAIGANAWGPGMGAKLNALSLSLFTYDGASFVASQHNYIQYPWAIHPFGSYAEPLPYIGIASHIMDWVNGLFGQ